MFKFFNFFFLLFFTSFSIQTFAADDGDWWLQRQVQLQQNREDYAKRVYGSARHVYDTQITENGVSKVKTVVKNVVVEDVPSKARLGKSLLQRAKAFRGGVAGVLGGAAVTALIEAVGWVMEEGTFVKYKSVDDNNCLFKSYLVSFGSDHAYCGIINAGQGSLPLVKTRLEGQGYTDVSFESCELSNPSAPPSSSSSATGTCTYSMKNNGNKTTNKYSVSAVENKNPSDNKTKIVITDEHVGGIVTGDYKDPVDPKYDITDQQYRPVVTDAYQHDPHGIGDDIANEMDDRIKNAPPTPDGKPAPPGDPKYKNPPSADGATNDRSWQDDGGKADADTTPKTDPETGEPTGGQSISLQFPVFCEWAHSMCKWYDDWKSSDKTYKDHLKKVEDHQIEEATFWFKVKDWFTWTKDDSDLPDRDDSDLNTTVDFEEKKIGLNVSPQCPAPTFETITLHGVTAQVKTSDYTYICQLDWLIKPFTIGFAVVLACFILFGFNRGSEG
ncbi:hypothetical protein F895_00004 [Acinetobacter sp. CIP 64.2]|uniref:virulence factor TspB C-terminal domain-related protein n=1 Tax=Acinetobacter sp. CIP 64.2 TaxID=1217694 RepID=UPI000289BC0C|nr:virulence factor TspB C-terminal domain-related protein [Acinetobacter sp. CIP 64.2]ENX18566.1 hypothetical protein F895_00004 [Acinetobacter sp. CIP 64.2]